MTHDPRRPFGRLLTAMVTPFDADGSLDVPGAQRLAEYLVDEQGNDGLVISGTTGEAPTTSDVEKETLLRAVVEAVGDRAKIVAGVGTFNTAHSIELARTAEKSGAHGLLVVTPYYSRPPQAGLVAHFTAVAEATAVPAILYDIPGRTATPIATDTLLRLADHPNIVAVKDAKGDVAATSAVTRHGGLAVYAGDDKMTLPLLAVGGVGVVGTPTHVIGRETRRMIELFEAGDTAGALAAHHRLLPVLTGFFRTQGTILVKAAMRLRGLPAGPVRLPLVDATDAEIAQLRADCAEAGVDL